MNLTDYEFILRFDQKIINEFAERVKLEHLDKICEALGCELGDLIQRVPDKIK